MVGDGGYGERRRRWGSAVREREGAAREREGDKARGSGRHREEAPRRRAGGGGRQTSWWRGAPAVRARRPHAWPTGARRTTAVVGWAGLLGRPAGWAAQGGAQVSSSCYLFFCFLISDICFDLNNILNHLFTLCQFLQELDILFQSSFIIGIIFGHILIYIINIFPMQIFMH